MSDRLTHNHYACLVSDSHILRATDQISGTPRSHSCPVALALNDATGAIWGVGPRRAFRRDFEKDGGPRNLIVIPAWLAHRIRLWDERAEMRPFRFVLFWGPRGEWLLEQDPRGGPVQ